MVVIALEFKKETPLGFCSFSLFTPTFLTTLKFIFVPVLQEELKGDLLFLNFTPVSLL